MKKCYIVICRIINDSIIKTHAERRKRKTQEGKRMKTSLQKYSPLTLLQGSERVVEGLHVRGCRRPNVNFIFWPHCYDRHVVSFLFSWCSTRGLGVHSIGGFREPPRSGVALPTTYGLYCLEVCWQLHRGFSRTLSVGCGLSYHIWSLLSGILLTTAWDPNSTELNNNSTPTRSPTGTLKSNV